MSDKIFMTSQEQARVASFIREQQEEWDAQEQQKMYAERLQCKEYEPQPFPGFDEATALQAIRNGWKSKLDLAFERKRKQETQFKR